VSRLRRVVAPVFGSAVLGGVAVLYLRPEWVLTAVPDLEALFAAIEPVVFLVGAVAMLGVAAVALVLRAKLFSSSSRTVDNTSERTESSQSLFAGAGAVHGQLGASFDVQFQMATDYGSTDRADREAARTQSIDELRSLAQDAYQQAAGCESETARHAPSNPASGRPTSGLRGCWPTIRGRRFRFGSGPGICLLVVIRTSTASIIR